MPTVSSGSGASAAEVFYEVRSNAASTSGRVWRNHGLLGTTAGRSTKASRHIEVGPGTCDWSFYGGYDCNSAGFNAPGETTVNDAHQRDSRQVAVSANQLGSYQTLWAKSIEDRAKVDLKLHFMKKTLNEVDTKYKRTRRSLLQEEYVEGQKGGGIGQPDYGFKGQLNAVWTHRVTDQKIKAIKSGQFPRMVIHGRYDILAMAKYGEQLARRLECPCMLLEGAHFVTRECGPEINLLLNHMVYHGQRIHNNPRKYLKPDRPSPVVVQDQGLSVEAVTLLQ